MLFSSPSTPGIFFYHPFAVLQVVPIHLCLVYGCLMGCLAFILCLTGSLARVVIGALCFTATALLLTVDHFLLRMIIDWVAYDANVVLLCDFLPLVLPVACGIGVALLFSLRRIWWARLSESAVVAHTSSANLLAAVGTGVLRVAPLLLILVFAPSAYGAGCDGCFGQAHNCPGSGRANCPWVTGIATNSAAVAAATGSAITLANLLPTRFLRAFPRAILRTLVLITSRTVGAFDPAGKTTKDIRQAVVSGAMAKDDALLEIADRLEALDPNAGDYDAKRRALESAFTIMKELGSKVLTAASADGAILFILARLSKFSCSVTSNSFELCVETDIETEISTPDSAGDGGARPAGGVSSATLTRPRSFAQMAALLNSFVLVCAASGVATPLSLLPFLDEVVYEPIRVGDLSWMVAFESLILYLRMVEHHPSEWNLISVVTKSGGIDAKRREATSIAHGLYPAAFFRPREGTSRGDGQDRLTGAKRIVVTSFNQGAKKGCSSWNLGNPHREKNVTNGKCEFFHGCDQYVSDKGPWGQCLDPTHKRAACTYDPALKLDQPLKK